MTLPVARKNLIEIAIHLLVWALIFSMPLLSFGHDQQHVPFNQFLRFSIFPLFFALVFYTNYFVLIPRLFFSKKLVIFFFANLLLYSACTFSMESMKHFNAPKLKMLKMKNEKRDRPVNMVRPKGIPSKTEMVLRSFIAFAMTTGVAVAIHSTNKWFHSEDLRKDLEREHLKSELDNLKNQLNPHFFFNTLNNIYSLISQNQDKAKDAVHQLSKLMRYLLYDSNEKFVPLSKEIDFLHHYIDLMKLRVNNSIAVEYSFPKETTGLNIAPLLFISLIENSFKHGISATKTSSINMEMTISTSKQLTFNISNTSFPKTENDQSGSGIGLENLRRRLNLLYPEKHSIKISAGPEIYQTILMVAL